MEDNSLLEYAGYDCIDAYLTKDSVLCMATAQMICYGRLSLLPIHEKLLEASNI